ncbi:MAG: hypothetical protein SGJ19_13390 [Planctomycetia bacterium]|nr:hypothetical protein [Planctomycetia bacterium]
MSVISGKDGKVMIGVTAVANITFWNFSTLAQNPAYASSATAGHRKRLGGVKDGGGVIRGKLDLTDAVTNDVNEGDSVTLLLYLNATKFYSVPAVIDRLQFEVDIDSGDVVGWEAEFGANGAWTKPTY